jgi:hypothetical protein
MVNKASRTSGHRRRGFGCCCGSVVVGRPITDGVTGAVDPGAPTNVRFAIGGGATGVPTDDGVSVVVIVERAGGLDRGEGVIENGLRSTEGATSDEGQGVSFSVLGGSHMFGPSLVTAIEASFTFHLTSEK